MPYAVEVAVSKPAPPPSIPILNCGKLELLLVHFVLLYYRLWSTPISFKHEPVQSTVLDAYLLLDIYIYNTTAGSHINSRHVILYVLCYINLSAVVV